MISLRNVSKHYDTPTGPYGALRQVDLEVGRGEMLAITGKSGSGKSTLLNVIAGIDRPSAGEVTVDGLALHDASERTMARWRGANAGIIFQCFQLLPTLTVAENVTLPMDFLRQRPPAARRSRALTLLERVGLREYADRFPAALSGGQQQRVAIARSLANEPRLVTADEPTGNLDTETAGAILELLRTIARDGTTVVIATHERDIAGIATRTVKLEDGRVMVRQ